jgi:uncharacterized protein (TIGR02145 family)
MTFRYSPFVLFFLLISVSPGFAEGTKEFRPVNGANYKGELCIDTARNKFGVITATADYRLYIHISDFTTEAIYFGFGTMKHNAGNTIFRFYRPNNVIDTSGTVPTATGVRGYIDDYAHAAAGPSVVAPGTGYWGLRCTPDMNGDYYLAFKITWLTGPVDDYKTWENFDVTVVKTTTWTAIPGRLWSKAWQLYCEMPNAGSNNQFRGKMFVYSADSIITKVDFNGIIPGTFTVSCNHSGCYASPPAVAATARKSVADEHTFPEYKIFLNDPDLLAYPSGTLGGLDNSVPITSVRNCDGTIDFTFGCTKAGNVELKLLLSNLGSPYVDRIIPQNVTLGLNTIHWDGYDGATPAHAIPNGAMFPFLISYVNGLTHLPLFDVEFNTNGFFLDLIRPTTLPAPPDPLFYWDDSNFNGGTNFAGCLPVAPSTGCHTWNSPPGGFGNNRTINTWWYAVSTSSAQTTITEKRLPGILTLSGPNQICQGGSASYSASTDPNAQEYHWSYPGGSSVSLVPGITITIPSNAPTGPGSVTVYGYNTECGAGPTASIPVTINPFASPSINGNNSVCIGATGITYTTQSGQSNYMWSISSGATVTAGGGTNSNFITVNWNLAGAQSISVNYTNGSTGCTASTPFVYPVTVNPRPVPVITGPATVCEGATGQLYSTQSGNFSYQWTIPTGATVTSGGGPNDNSVTLSWTASGTHIIYVNYTNAFGCTATAASFLTVTVNGMPTVSFNYITPSACSGVPLNIQLSSNISGATFSWNATGSSSNVLPQTASGIGNITNSFINNGTAIENVVFSVTPTATGCSPAGAVLSAPIPIYPVPDLITTPAALTVCSNSAAAISLSSVVQNTTYAWTATGGAGITPATITGSGNIAEIFQNSGTAPSTVSFNIVPTANGCSNSGLSPYILNVNPRPGVVFPASPANPQTICSGTNTATVNLLSTVTLPGVSWAWNAAAYDPISPTANISGFTTPNSGSSIPGELISSTLTGPGLIKYEVTATYTNDGVVCPGDPSEYQVVVNPSPTVSLLPADPAGQTICSGTSSQAITFISNASPVSYTWQAVEVVGVNPPVMSGSTDFIPAQTLSVTGPSQGHVKYKVSIIFLGSGSFSCSGTDSYSTIFVNPLPSPVISSATPQTLCEYQANVAYSTPYVAGNSYTWTVTGAASVANASTSAVTVNWDSYTGSPGTLTVNEKIDATGCEKTSATYQVILQQRPIPTLTGLQTVCDGTTGVTYQTETGMSDYAWSISGGSITAGGTTTSSTATVTWNTPGPGWIRVNYINGLGCPGFPAKNIPVTVNPLPVSAISAGAGVTCQSQTHSYLTTADEASGFAWSVIPSASGSITSGQGTHSVDVTWLTSGNATVALTATRTATGCSTSSTHPVLVNPSPVPAFNACFDLITTRNARKFMLRGGSPYLTGQGVFSGSRVSYNAGTSNYEFDPFGASTGTYPITYTYTNTFGCSASPAAVTITIMSPSFTCGNDLTDVRDGKKYKTALIGSQCWMNENLSYGTILDPSTKPQTDNCVVEKYCLPSDVNCTGYGGLYQWDELMAYASAPAGQGICPPEWHIPTEAEWQTMLIAFANGVTPPVDGIAGSFLKDALANPGFHGLVQGIYYLNNYWSFTTGIPTGTMYWTSTPDGASRGTARGANSLNPSVSKYQGSRGDAFSVRCVKD